MTPDNKIDLANLVKGGCAWVAVKTGEVVAATHAAAITTASSGRSWLVDTMAWFGIHSWGEASQAAAWFLSACLIGDFFWKRFFRKYAERHWPNRFPLRRKRRSDFVDSSDHTPLGDK